MVTQEEDPPEGVNSVTNPNDDGQQIVETVVAGDQNQNTGHTELPQEPMEIEENVSINFLRKSQDMFLKLAKEETNKMLKIYAKANVSTHESIMKPYNDLVVATNQREVAIAEKNEELTKENEELEKDKEEVTKENEELKKENEFLQNLVSGGQQGNLNSSTIPEQTLAKQMVSILAANGVNTLKKLEELIGEKEDFQKFAIMQNEIFQKQTQQMEAKMKELKKSLREAENRIKAMKGPQAEREEATRFIETNQRSNSYSRIDHGKRMPANDIHRTITQYVSDIYSCRCPVGCTFVLKEAMSARTSSPSQLQRMVALTKAAPELLLKENARELLLVTQSHIQGLSTTPDADTFLALSNCPTLSLFVKDIRGWEQEYIKFKQSVLEQFLGKEFENKETIQMILAPGVRQESVPLQNIHTTILDNESIIEDVVHEQCTKLYTSIVVVVVPVSNHDSDLEMWRDIVNAIPAKATVYVIPTYMHDFDHSVMAVFISLFDRIKRDHGDIVQVSPEEIVSTKQHRMLYLASEIMKAPEYWQVVKEMLAKKNRTWPHFQIASNTKLTVHATKEFESNELQSSSTAPRVDRPEWNRGEREMIRGRGNARGGYRGGRRDSTYHPYRGGRSSRK